MMLPAGLLIILAIVVPWYAALYERDGWKYIVSFFVGENIDRFTSGLGVRVERPVYFYVPVVFSDSFPWALYLIPAAAAWWRGRRAVEAADPRARVRSLLWLWIVTFVGFFSLSAGKQDLYIFPIVPAIAALAGLEIARATGRDGAGVARTTIAIGAVLLVIGAALVYLFEAAGAAYAIEGVAAIGVIGLVAGAVTIWLAWHRRLFAASTVLATGFILLNGVFVLRTLPSFEAYKPVPAFAATIAARAAAGDVVATYYQAMPSLVYYLRRHVVELFDEEGLLSAWRSGQGVYAVMSATDLARVRAQLPGACELQRRPTFDVKLNNVLARKPLPELVLITNKCGG
jgi:4-amino-4-deoxy-L-arabinose transferase-like glycosyltransferase